MSDLSKYINKHRREFEMYVDNVNGDTTVFVEIVSRKTGCWLNVNVTAGNELSGLQMLIAEWNCLDSFSNLSQTIN